MKTMNKVLAGAAALVLFASCSADYLETAPTASTATATVFSSADNVKMAVNGLAYLMTTQHGAYSQGYCGENRIKSIYGEYPSQEFRYNKIASGWADIMNWTDYLTKPNTSYTKYPWGYYYGIICDANSIICNVDGAEGDANEIKFYKAQALTFRAYCYTKLLELYAPRWKDGDADAVVLRLDESTGDIPISKASEVYAQIYKDLDEAITLFNESGLDRPSGEVWLTNINVAHAVYAHVALNKQDYATALSHAKSARQGYPLMSNADYKAGFCEPTSEWIWGSFAGSTENNWYWTFGTQFSCNGYYSQASDYGAGAIETELTDRIPDNDVRKQLFLTADKFPGTDWSTAINSTYGYFNNAALEAAARAYLDANTPSCASGAYKAYQSGYYYLGGQLKFWVFGLPGLAYLPFFRSSEMVLIEAEANYFLNKTADAQASLVELNAKSGRNPEYTCTKTGDALFQEIRDYRELELFGEGYNFFDMKRWGLDIVRKSFAQGGNAHVAIAVTIPANQNNKWTLAVPESETLYNKAL